MATPPDTNDRDDRDELALDLTDEPTALLADLTVAVLADTPAPTDVPELDEARTQLLAAHEQATDELVLVADAIPLFAGLVFELADHLATGAHDLDALTAEAYLEAAEQFFADLDTAFPDLVAELQAEDTDEDFGAADAV